MYETLDEQEAKLKSWNAAAARAMDSVEDDRMASPKGKCVQESSSFGGAGCGESPMMGKPRPSVADRVAVNLNRARAESRRRDRLEELNFLLGKHPEVARILDLMQDLDV